MDLTIRPELPNDHDAVREILAQAFSGNAEARLVHELRERRFVEVELVAVIDGSPVGHILFSRLTIVKDARATGALALAPLAVLPEHQRRGIGSQLILAGLKACARLDFPIVVVVGHPEYYRKFGFSSDHARHLHSPYDGGDAWMALELEPGALQRIRGHVEYPPPFHDLD